jgi:FG-GAP-like repeat
LRIDHIPRPPRRIIGALVAGAALGISVAVATVVPHAAADSRTDTSGLSPVGHFPEYAPVVPNTDFVDIDGDGRADLIDNLGRTSQRRTAYRNHGWNTPQSIMAGDDSRLVAAGMGDAAHSKFADLDGDGRADLLSMADGNEITVLRNRGWSAKWVFAWRDAAPVGADFGPLAGLRFADLDGDRRADLVAVTDHKIVAYRNRGWAARPMFTPADRWVIAGGFDTLATVDFADMDGDGRADLLTQPSATAAITAHRNHGWGTPGLAGHDDTKPAAVGFGPLWLLKFGDLDGDGRADLVLAVGLTWPGHRNLGWSAPTLIPDQDGRGVAGGFAV